jgi:hypothetical protein
MQTIENTIAFGNFKPGDQLAIPDGADFDHYYFKAVPADPPVAPDPPADPTPVDPPAEEVIDVEVTVDVEPTPETTKD